MRSSPGLTDFEGRARLLLGSLVLALSPLVMLLLVKAPLESDMSGGQDEDEEDEEDEDEEVEDVEEEGGGRGSSEGELGALMAAATGETTFASAVIGMILG